MENVDAQDWQALAESLTPEALILRLNSEEHDFVERKPKGQKGDWLQTAVAFANSAPLGWPAVLYVGVSDAGEAQYQTDQLEDAAKSVSDVLGQAYPSIYRHIVPLTRPGGFSCLAVVIPGSPSRPHFAGQSYVRDGPQTLPASEQQFQRLIDMRSSTVYELQEWRGRAVTFERVTIWGEAGHASCQEFEAEVTFVNRFYVTLKYNNNAFSFPIRNVLICWDDRKSRLKLMLEERRITR